jgi:ubiquinone/menaquinone biosynthesis C-methylase UbiE
MMMLPTTHIKPVTSMASFVTLTARAAHPRRTTAAASPSSSSSSSTSQTANVEGANPLLLSAVEALFKFPPVFKLAAKGARKKIVDRGQLMGLDFAAEIEALKQVDWEKEMATVVDSSISTPNYYRVPFHAYPDGNLSMESALEVTVAAKSVHATVMDPAGKELDPEGDEKLRCSFSTCILRLLKEQNARPVRDIVDIGAATGLSSLALLKAFPEASVTGIDLSPHFLAAGRYLQRQREERTGKKEQLKLIHGLAEDTRLPSECVDLVSICLVCHELPESASRAIFKEAARILRPGGALAVMEMNPESKVFQKVMQNPIPYTIFKSTEPWLLEYVGMDMTKAMMDAGFVEPKQLENSPRHKSVVAIKK